MENTKVLLVNSLFAPIKHGGAEVSVEGLADYLASKKRAIYVVTLKSISDKRAVYRFKGVVVIRVSLLNIYWPFSSKRGAVPKAIWHSLNSINLIMAIRVAAIVARVRPEIVQLHNVVGFSPLLPLLLKHICNSVFQYIHDYSVLCYKTTMNQCGVNCKYSCVRCRIASIPGRIAFFHVDRYFYNSEFTKDRILTESLGLRRKDSYVTYGIIENKAAYIKSEVRRSSNSRLDVGYLGRVCDVKGVGVLCEAVAGMPEDYRLTIAGNTDNPEGYNLIQRFSRKNIRFIGYSEPGKLFNEIDVLVVPSLWNEPMGRVVIEANLYGVPVIVSNRGGLPELVINGCTGFVVEPSVDEIRARLASLTRGECRAMASACCAYAERFSPEKWGTRFFSLWDDNIERALVL